MKARTETRLRRLERASTGRGPDRIVVVESEAARAFLQGRTDVNMSGKMTKTPKTGYAQLAGAGRACIMSQT